MRKILLVLVLSVLKLCPANAQGNWELKTDKDGIKVYVSQVTESKIKAIKVECDVNATASQLVALIMDVNTATGWVYHLKSCSLLKQVSPSGLYYYAEVNLPWPAENRDFVGHLTVTQNPDTKVVTIDGPSEQGMVPIKTGIVRITNSFGKWVITPTGTNKINVQYTILVDPGGSIPSWLVNMFAIQGPLQIFRNMKLQLQRPVYKNIGIAFVNNEP